MIRQIEEEDAKGGIIIPKDKFKEFQNIRSVVDISKLGDVASSNVRLMKH